ncbi:BnaA09g39090D [Brassica napus]|uniref:AT-hook motif nuclear-localized protein n=1 Tax=Brassica napus TaxID=3708 RepID=A0A078IIJ5_BRANA|nr:unnamed protein product [Brassica napus]CDY48928.1 BnaA09g39090D [Brassica napus]
MDRREAMSGSYYIQRGMPGSAPPPPQTQQPFHGSQGFHHFSNPNSPFVSNPNLNQVGGGGGGGGSTAFVSPPLPIESSPADSSAPAAAPPPPQSGEKRKRGRPRKYGQEGPVSLALSPSMSPNSNKRGRGRPPGSGKKQRLGSTGELMPSSSGMSFTPHVIAVSVGEDIASKVLSFSQQGPRATCVLSVSGAVSTATILQPSPSQGAIKYEGRFELLSLSISYLNATENDYSNRTGNLSVSLASPDGRVTGGGIGGPLIAASPVQVIVGSFLWAVPKGKVKKRDEASEDVQDTDGLENNDNNTAPTSPPQQSQNLDQTPVGMWSTGSRSMDMHHAHMDIDLMRG